MEINLILMAIELTVIFVEIIVFLFLIKHIYKMELHNKALDIHLSKIEEHTIKMDNHLNRIESHVNELDNHSQIIEKIIKNIKK